MSVANGQIRALAERVAASHGLDVVDLEFVGGSGKYRTLRIFLERNAAGRAVLAERLAAMRAAETLPDAELKATFEGKGEAESEQESAGEDEARELDGGEASDGAIELDLVEAGEAAGLSPEEDELAYLREVPAGVPVAQLSGITHGDCERFSRDFGTALDIEDLVPGAEYMLEASSPGLDRKLSSREEFVRFAGTLCKVQTFTPVGGNRHWQGHLGPLKGDTMTLVPVAAKGAKRNKKADPQDTGKAVEIALSNVEKAQLVPEF